MAIYSPEQGNNQIPILFAPGWSITLNHSNDFLVNLANTTESSVISLNHLREINEGEEVEDKKADSLELVLNESGFEKVNAIGYSEGAINLLLLALKHPEKFKNIVLLNPSGIIDNTKIIDILKVVGGFNVDLMKLKNLKLKSYWESLKYILNANPLLSIREIIMASGGIDIKDMINELEEKGVKICIVHGNKDQVFPMEKMLDETTKSEFYENFHGISSAYIPKMNSKLQGNHFDIIDHPQKIAETINYLLKNLEEN